MFGNNPKRPPVKHDGSYLDVQEIFPTIQGEGIYAGHPAIFVRLGGCNLACDFCDTEFESYSKLSLEEVVAQVKQYMIAHENNAGNIAHLVVITGGEPLRQELAPLCQKLLADGFRVQIETNGTIYRNLPDGVDIICSPKASVNSNSNDGKTSETSEQVKWRYFPIRPDLLARISALKFIISKNPNRIVYNNVPDLGQGEYGIPVYIQPMDEYNEQQNLRNTKYCVELVQKYGYILSLQTHKYLGIE